MSERDGTDNFESTSRQHASTEVEELCGRTCERLLGVTGGSEGRLLFFYLRADGVWFRGFLDVGVFFLSAGAPDPEDDLEAGEGYLDLAAALGVQGARVRSFAMRDGVLRIEFDTGEPLVLRGGGDDETRWQRPSPAPQGESSQPGPRAAEKVSRGFEVLRDRGASPSVACRIASAWGLERIERIRMLRVVYGLSLRDAKEVMIVDSGLAASLDEHQARVFAELMAASEEELRALFGVLRVTPADAARAGLPATAAGRYIVNGHHRVRAAAAAGIDVVYEEVSFASARASFGWQSVKHVVYAWYEQP